MKTLSFILLILGWVTGLSAQHHHNHETGLNASEINAEHSLYHLDVDWIDHRGDTYTLSDFRGRPVIVVMFYGNCTQVCPILIQDTWRLFSMLAEADRATVHVLAITFDTENDTPEVLHEYAEYEQLNIPGWHFLSSEPANVRTLAMLLGVQYSKKSDGHFAHSNLVTVLDGQGRIAKRVEGLNQTMDEAAETIRSIIDKNVKQ